MAPNAGRADAGRELFADDLVFNGQRIGARGIGQMRWPLWRAVPDIRLTLEQAIAEGNWVAAR